MALQGSVGEIRTNQEHFSLKNEKKLRTASLKQNLLVLTKKKSVSTAMFLCAWDFEKKFDIKNPWGKETLR